MRNESDPEPGASDVVSPPTSWWRVRDGQIVLDRCNEAAREASAGRVDSLLGRSASEIFSDQPVLLADLERCAREGGVLLRRALPYLRRITSEPRLLDVIYTFVAPDTVMLHGLDITERQAAEEARAAAETRLQRVMSHVPLALWTVEAGGTLTHAEGPGLREIGLAPEDVIGRPVAEVLADSPEALRALARALAGETVDVTIPWRGRVLVARSYPERDRDGTLVAVNGITIDVTERMHTAARLRLSENRLQRLVSTNRLMIWAADRDGRITEGQAFEVFGLAPGEAVGRNIRDPLFAPDDAARQRIERAYQGESMRTVREVNGRVYESEYFPDKDEAGHVTGLTGLVMDVTHWRKAEERAQATETRVRQIVDSVPIILTRTDRAGLITLCEGHGLHAVGLRPGERVGASVLEPPVSERSIACFRRALAGETVSAVGVYRGRTFQNHFFPERDGAGEIAGVACLSLDVTERAEAEAALQETEKHLRRLMSNADVILWSLDKDGVFTLSEGKGLAALGLEPGQVVGQRARDLYADVPAALEMVERMLAGEKFSTTLDVRGSVFEVHTFPDRDERGEPAGGSGLAIDISHHQRTIQELQASEERFRQFAENLREGCWIATPDLSRTFYSNPACARILGEDPATFLPTYEHLRAAIHPDDRERMGQVARSWRPEEPAEDTYRIVRRDGSARWIRGRVFPIHTVGGKPTQIAVLIEDVTEARRLESEARRIRDHLADAQRIARAGNWEWDVGTGELWGSEEMHRILGLPASDQPIPFDRLIAAVHAEDQPLLEQALGASQTRGAALDTTCRLRRPDGSVRAVRLSGEAALGASGRPVRMIGTLQDVTESREAEKAVAILSGAVEQTADLVFITDRQGRLEYVNPAFESHTGYSRGEVAGRTPRVLRSSRSPAALFEELWDTILSGRTFRGVMANRKKNGDVFYEEKTITPIRDSLGKITHFVSVGRDITERRETEEVQLTLQAALRKSAEEWKVTFDAVDSPIVLAGPGGRVRRLNRAARDLWGEPYEQILGRELSECPGEPWATMRTAVERVARQRTPVSLSAESEGRTRTWGVAAGPLPSGAGEPGVIVMAKDISDIVRLQDSLRHSERMSAMGALVAGVAHEVRNPLFGISSTLDAFEARFGRREEYAQYVAILREQLDRMTDFMRELLEYGKPAPLELAPGVLEDVIAQAVHACGALARRTETRVANNVKRGLPPVHMDRRRLVQVFQNLVDNALRHSPRGATVEVDAETTGGPGEPWVECHVCDRGPGFRPEDLGQIFEPFFTRRRGGTGLGLSIVQRIVEEHGGSVSAENRPDGGAVMRVRLPAARPGPAAGGPARGGDA